MNSSELNFLPEKISRPTRLFLWTLFLSLAFHSIYWNLVPALYQTSGSILITSRPQELSFSLSHPHLLPPHLMIATQPERFLGLWSENLATCTLPVCQQAEKILNSNPPTLQLNPHLSKLIHIHLMSSSRFESINQTRILLDSLAHISLLNHEWTIIRPPLKASLARNVRRLQSLAGISLICGMVFVLSLIYEIFTTPSKKMVWERAHIQFSEL